MEDGLGVKQCAVKMHLSHDNSQPDKSISTLSFPGVE